MLVFIDNYDSFTYNLVHAFQKLGAQVKVVRHHYPLAEICNLNPALLVVGPGPGNPSQAGISKESISYFAGKIPVLGVCLGHQALGEVFGGKVIKAPVVMHGKMSRIYHQNQGIFQGLSAGFQATRYHSLIVDKESLPPCLEITAHTDCGEIMGLRHKEFSIESVQFHPESIATEQGLTLLKNFIRHLA